MLKKPTRGKGLLENFLATKRAQKANSLIPKEVREGRILDLGCGSYPYFLFSIDFKERFGIDPLLDEDLCKNCRINLKKEKIGEGKLPYNENFFDVVTMLAVFEHIEKEKIQNLLKEIRRVLKKEGFLIITTPAPWADSLLHFMGKVGLISSEEINEHKHNHKRDKIEDMLERVGFKKNGIKSGFFEAYANMWLRVVK